MPAHGGRRLESAPLVFSALSNIRVVLGERFPLFYDSGLRNSEDIIKAYTQGANFVMLGRPLLFAMAAKGEEGLEEFCDVYQQELSIALALMGLSAISDIDPAMLPNKR